MSWWSLRIAISQGVNLSWFSMKRGDPWFRSSSTQRFKPDVAAQCSAVLPFCHLGTKIFINIENKSELRVSYHDHECKPYILSAKKGLTPKQNDLICLCLIKAYLHQHFYSYSLIIHYFKMADIVK
jgi:hypothetical protein